MADYLIQDTTLDAIADAINAKTGGSSAMTPAQMVTAIGSIQTGGGGSGYQLLASGTYTYSNSATGNLNIPVSFTGDVAFAYAVAEEIIPNANQSYCFLAIHGLMPFTQYFVAQKVGVVSAVNTSGVVSANATNSAIRVDNGTMYLSRANNTYQIQPNTYHWFIYGEATA